MMFIHLKTYLTASDQWSISRTTKYQRNAQGTHANTENRTQMLTLTWSLFGGGGGAAAGRVGVSVSGLAESGPRGGRGDCDRELLLR